MKTRGKLTNPDVGAEVMAAEKREIYEGNCYGVCSADDFLSHMPAGPGSGAAVCQEYHGQRWIDNFRVFWYPDAKSTATFKISGLKRLRDSWHEEHDYFIMVQFWTPKRSSSGSTMLTVSEQSFTMGKLYNGLCRYRYRCVQQEIDVREVCPIGRVFNGALPECFGNINSCSIQEFPMKTYALDCGIRQYHAWPVFERGDGERQCIGVLEILSATRIVSLLKDLVTLLESTDFECTSSHDQPRITQEVKAETSTEAVVIFIAEDLLDFEDSEMEVNDQPPEIMEQIQDLIPIIPLEDVVEASTSLIPFEEQVEVGLAAENLECEQALSHETLRVSRKEPPETLEANDQASSIIEESMFGTQRDYLGMTELADAADKIEGLGKQPFRKRKKVLNIDSCARLQKTKLVEVGECSSSGEAEGVEVIPENSKGKSAAPEDENGRFSRMNVKATYRNKCAKFPLCNNLGIEELRRQLEESLKLENEKFEIKYKDEDGECINLCCDKDLLFHVETLKASGKSTMKLEICTTEEAGTTLEKIMQYRGRTTQECAAEKPNVPPSALRPRKWPSLKGNKFHQIQSSVNFVEVEGQEVGLAAFFRSFIANGQKFDFSEDLLDFSEDLLDFEKYEMEVNDQPPEIMEVNDQPSITQQEMTETPRAGFANNEVHLTLEMTNQYRGSTTQRNATEKLGGDDQKEDHLIQIIPLEDVVEASASLIPFEEQVEVGSRQEVGLAAENLECEQALSHETLRANRKEPPETLEANDQASSIIKESMFGTQRDYLGMIELADAADKIEGLGKQPFCKRKKVPNIDSCARLQKTKLVEVGECSSSGEVEAVEVIPENSKGKSAAPEDENGRFSRMNVKATYRNKCAKFPLCNNLGIEELRRQLEESLKLENEKFEIKYKDEDGECINLCCDKDLLFHVETLKASGKSTIKLEICTTEEAGTTLEKIMQYRGRTTQEFAAAKLNVSLNTLKRSCKTLGLGRWPSSKRKKVHDPPKSRERLQVTESSENAFQESENGQCSNNNPPENEAVTAKLIPVNTKGENGEIVVKATYDGDTAMFPLRYDSGFKELRQELDETFGFGSEKFKIKYKDGDGGWITLFRDKDLLFRIQTLKASGESTMELSVSLVS